MTRKGSIARDKSTSGKFRQLAGDDADPAPLLDWVGEKLNTESQY